MFSSEAQGPLLSSLTVFKNYFFEALGWKFLFYWHLSTESHSQIPETAHSCLPHSPLHDVTSYSFKVSRRAFNTALNFSDFPFLWLIDLLLECSTWLAQALWHSSGENYTSVHTKEKESWSHLRILLATPPF